MIFRPLKLLITHNLNKNLRKIRSGWKNTTSITFIASTTQPGESETSPKKWQRSREREGKRKLSPPVRAPAVVLAPAFSHHHRLSVIATAVAKREKSKGRNTIIGVTGKENRRLT
jgi:hypothetical protein